MGKGLLLCILGYDSIPLFFECRLLQQSVVINGIRPMGGACFLCV